MGTKNKKKKEEEEKKNLRYNTGRKQTDGRGK